MKKLLIICGPTATGKTGLGINLAKKLNGEIISADSRQVYRGMDWGTGKDVSGFTYQTSDLTWQEKPLGYYHHKQAKIWGYDLVEPNQDFSLAHFQQFTSTIIPDIHSRNKLPIVVGGTGLYLKSLSHSIDTSSIKPNLKLRQELEPLSVKQLQQKFQQLNSDKYQSMNHSDQLNPRRLIRAIEIAMAAESETKSGGTHPNQVVGKDSQQYDQLWIGLAGPIDLLDQRVGDNVQKRSLAINDEISTLLSQHPEFWSYPSATATGYHQWKQYLDHQITKNKAISLWIKAETQYLRRQNTWFKKQSQINWHNISSPSAISSVEAQVEDWYSKSIK